MAIVATQKMINIVKTYTSVVMLDRMVAKTLAMNEISQMAMIEKRLYEMYVISWEKLSSTAATNAGNMFAKGKSKKEILAKINKTMGAWAGVVGPIATRELKNTYKLGRQAGIKRASGLSKKPLEYQAPKNVPVSKAKGGSGPFDMVDNAVVKSLNKNQIFWVGNFYEDGVSDGIASTVKKFNIKEGVSAAASGEIFEGLIEKDLKHVKLPSGWAGTSRQYMEGLTANAMTTARVHGQMRSFASIGVPHYTISNPSDKRTCPTCNHLEGKTFTLKQGLEQMENDLAASSPEEVKMSHPWLTPNQIKKISPKPGMVPGKAGVADSKALAASGQALPTYHFRCRCTVDVDYESVSYDMLSPMPMSVVPSPIKRHTSNKKWVESLSSEERRSFKHWTTHGYSDIRSVQLNEFNRIDEYGWNAANAAIDGIRSAFARAPKYKRKIMRGLHSVSAKDVEATMVVGNKIRNEAMSSWSKSETQATKFAKKYSDGSRDKHSVLMEIKPKTRSFNIEKLSAFPAEKEVLMEEGGVMEVISVKKEVIGTTSSKYNLYRVTLKEVE